MCAEAITPKLLCRFPGSQVLDRWCGCWMGASAVAAPVSGLFNSQPTKRITRANRLPFGPMTLPFSPSSIPAWPNAFTQGRLPVGEFDFLAFLPSGEFDIVRHRRPRQQGGRDNSMSSHSIHTNRIALSTMPPCASATVGLFDQAMVTAKKDAEPLQGVSALPPKANVRRARSKRPRTIR
jgi:hypothetical protein